MLNKSGFSTNNLAKIILAIFCASFLQFGNVLAADNGASPETNRVLSLRSHSKKPVFDGDAHEHKADELLVKYKTTGLANSAMSRLPGALSGKVRKAKNTWRKLNNASSGDAASRGAERMAYWRHIQLEPGTDLKQAFEEFMASPDVEFVQLNYRVSIDLDPPTVVDEVSRYSELWGLNNTGQSYFDGSGVETSGTIDADIDAPEAWNITTGSRNVVVAVIDTGVDYTHEDLAANMWTNAREIIGDGIDNDGNGYIDDIYGYNAINNYAEPADTGFPIPAGNPMDDHSHGTHVSGTIAGVGTNGKGVVGVSWNSRIMAVKFLNASGRGYITDATKAINYVVNTKLTNDTCIECEKYSVITSNSWGGGNFDQLLQTAIEAANDANILFVAAAGNSALNTDINNALPQGYPVPNIISVAASTSDDEFAYFSNIGVATVDLAAPGHDILSSVPTFLCANCSPDGYNVFSGTSMATPHVSGVAALLLSVNPNLTPRQLKAKLLASVDPIADFKGQLVSGGRLNAENALNCISTQPIISAAIADNFIAYVGEDAHLVQASLYNCDDYLVDGSIVVSLDNGGPGFTLVDDGTSGDEYAGDGVYSYNWQPQLVGPVNLTFDATHSAGTISQIVPGQIKKRFYQWEDTAYEWVDTITATEHIPAGRSWETTVPIGFSFPFYGQLQGNITISAAGYLTFNNVATGVANSPLPDTLAPNNIIAVNWASSNNTKPSSRIYTLIEGAAPNRRFTVTWQDMIRGTVTSADGMTWQATLYESSGDIIYRYLDVDGGLLTGGVQSTIGVEDSYGLDGTVYLYNGDIINNPPQVIKQLSNESAVRFFAQGIPGDNTPPVASFTVPAANFFSEPTMLDASASSDPEGLGLTYIWDFGDDTTIEYTQERTIEHTYTGTGDFTITLVVFDGVQYSTPVTNSTTVEFGAVDFSVDSVQIVNAPNPLSTGQDVTVSVTLTNVGTQKGSATIYSWLLTDPATPTPGTTSSLVFGSIRPELQAGETATFEITAPVKTSLNIGNYYIRAKVLTDANFSNNENTSASFLAVTGIGPDIAFDSLSGPTRAVANDSVQLNYVLRDINSSGTVTGGSAIQFYLSLDAFLTPDVDIPIVAGSSSYGPDGYAYNTSVTFTVPDVATVPNGTYYIIADADTNNDVVESDENNNIFTGNQITIGLVNRVPVANPGGPYTGVPGQPVAFDGSASSDEDSDPLRFNWTNFGDLGSSYNGGANPTHTYARPGIYTASLTVNDGIQNSVPETTMVTITGGNDLTISNLALSNDILYMGDAASLTFGVTNLGGSDATENMRLEIYFSQDTVYGAGDTRILSQFLRDDDNDGVVIANGQTIPFNQPVDFTWPMPRTAGNYFVGVKVEFTSIPELDPDQSNNIVWIPVTINTSPDFNAISIQAAGADTNNSITLPVGGVLPYSMTASNVGSSQSGTTTRPVKAYLQLDSDPTVKIYIGGFNFTWNLPNLKAGEVATNPIDVTLPASVTPGSYTLLMDIDPDNAITDELFRDNNAVAGSTVVVVTPEPDFIVSAFTLDGSVSNQTHNGDQVFSGETLQVSVIVKNIGNSASSNSITTNGKYYFSTDEIIDPFTDTEFLLTDYFSLSNSVPVNGEVSGGTELTIPTGLTAGTYYLGFYADVPTLTLENGAQQELLENNNTAVIPITIVEELADLVLSEVSVLSTNIGVGDSFEVRNTALNQGVTDAFSDFNVGLYLSDDDILSNDDRMLSFRLVPGLAHGLSDTSDTLVYLPVDLIPGFYYIIGSVDYSQRITESFDTNNELASLRIGVGVTGNAPVANPGGPYSSGVASAIVFDGSGSNDADGDVLTYNWDFGDDTTGSGVNPSHSYAAEGTYLVSLYVNDGALNSPLATTTATISNNTLPIASAGIDQIVTEGDAVALDGTGSSDVEGPIASFSWSQTAGPAVVLTGASTSSPSFIAPDVAMDTALTFLLTVTDSDGATATDSVNVSVLNIASVDPIANLGGPYSVNEGESITLDGSASSDPSATGVGYGWTYTTGGTGYDMGHGVEVDNNGNVIYVGHLEGTVDADPTAGVDTKTSNGDSDAIITKLNSDGSYAWSRMMGGATFDRGSSVTTDNSGNIFVAGQFTGAVDFNPGGIADIHTSANSGTEYDIFLTKINVDGSYAWTRVLGGYFYIFGKTIATDSAGNVFVTGAFSIPQDFDLEGAGDLRTPVLNSTDIFITKINSDGSYGWTHTLGNSGYDMGHSVTVDALDNVYVTGHYTGTVGLDPTAAVSNFTSTAGTSDAFIIKYSSSGIYDWTRTFGGDGWDGTYNIETDTAGNVYVSGLFSGTSDLDPTAGIDSHTAQGTYDLYVNKLNADGSFAWARTFGQASTFSYDVARPGFWNYTGNAMTVDGNGNTYVSRCFANTMDLDPTAGIDNRTSSGLADIFVTKLNSDGSYDWSRTMGGSGDDCANAVAAGINGDVYVTGNFQGAANFDPSGAGDVISSAGDNDLFITRLSGGASSLTFFWEQTGGPTVTLIGANTATPSFVAPFVDVDTQLTFLLTVTNSTGGTASSSVDVSVINVNLAPVANAGGPYSGETNAAIVFDGSSSSDPDGDALTYTWDFGDGSIDTTSGANPNHIYALSGSYTVSLIVNDGSVDSTPSSTSVEVVDPNQTPVAVIGGPYSGETNAAVTFDGSASSDPDGDALTYTWDFGDGTIDTTSGVSPAHTYTVSGTYNISLTVNDGQVNSLTVFTTVEIADGGPFVDVSMTAISAPTSAVMGGALSVTSTVTNLGTKTTNGNVYIQYFISSDTIFDGGDLSLGSVNKRRLKAGASKSDSRTFTLPANVTNGTYYVLAVADRYNNVSEIDDPDNLNGNNLIVAANTTVVSLDADVSMTAISAPTNVVTGGSMVVTSTVTNIGSGDTTGGYVYVEYFMSSDATFDSGDLSLGATNMGALSAGQSKDDSRTFTVSAGVASGTYYVLAVADRYNNVSEIDDPDNLNGNNLIVAGNTTTVGTVAGADVSMTSISSPTNAVIGGSMAVTSTVTNIGSGDTTGGYVYVEYFMSSDATFDSGDLSLGATNMGTLSVGESKNDSRTFTVPTSVSAGTYYVLAVADRYNNVTELDDPDNLNGNNLIVAGNTTVLIIGADVSMTAIDAPTNVSIGGNMAVTSIVSNLGSGKTDGNVYVEYFISSDTIYDSGDVSLGSVNKRRIRPGQSKNDSRTLTLPASLAGGTYYLLAVADRFNNVTEIDDPDNLNGNNLIISPSITIN